MHMLFNFSHVWYLNIISTQKSAACIAFLSNNCAACKLFPPSSTQGSKSFSLITSFSVFSIGGLRWAFCHQFQWNDSPFIYEMNCLVEELWIIMNLSGFWCLNRAQQTKCNIQDQLPTFSGFLTPGSVSA